MAPPISDTYMSNLDTKASFDESGQMKRQIAQLARQDTSSGKTALRCSMNATSCSSIA
jgi:hypothetical protein